MVGSSDRSFTKLQPVRKAKEMLHDFLRDRMAKLLVEKPELRLKANKQKLLDELNNDDIEVGS